MSLSSNWLAVLAPFGVVDSKLVRNPAPTVSGPRLICAHDCGTTTSHTSSKSNTGAHRRAISARSLRTRVLGMNNLSSWRTKHRVWFWFVGRRRQASRIARDGYLSLDTDDRVLMRCNKSLTWITNECPLLILIGDQRKFYARAP